MSTLNVDKVDPSTGTTLELGTSGDTVNLGSGVTAGTGFGGDLSFGGDTFGANKVIGANDAYSFSLETSGNTALTIDSTGAITKPLQPAFLAKSAAVANVTGDGTEYTMTYTAAERFDQNGDFDGTSTFTAPVTGKYAIYATCYVSGVLVTHTEYFFTIATSNNSIEFNSQQNASRYPVIVVSGTAIMDMDASDTCVIKATFRNSTKVVDQSEYGNYFGAWLVC